MVQTLGGLQLGQTNLVRDQPLRVVAQLANEVVNAFVGIDQNALRHWAPSSSSFLRPPSRSGPSASRTRTLAAHNSHENLRGQSGPNRAVGLLDAQRNRP